MAEDARGGRAPSIRDVASAAGVSHQTVSRVLNGHASIRPDTERRVRLAIDDLGWRPNRAARSLATARHATIGLLTTARSLYGPMRASIGLEEAARAAGYGYTSASATEEGAEGIAAALAALLAQGVDGIVVYAPQRWARDCLATLAPREPTVSLYSGGIGAHVAFDQEHGAREAVRHLVGLGHRRIALLPGPADWVEADQRQGGYRAEVAARGLEPMLLPAGDWSSDSGYESARFALPQRRFTAVLCANDEMAIGLLHAAHEAGIRVPGELSVVGFDDVAEARHATPPLTTLRQDFVQLGREAVRVLVDELEMVTTGRPDVSVGLDLVIRSSTGAPGLAAPA